MDEFVRSSEVRQRMGQNGEVEGKGKVQEEMEGERKLDVVEVRGNNVQGCGCWGYRKQ